MNGNRFALLIFALLLCVSVYMSVTPSRAVATPDSKASAAPVKKLVDSERLCGRGRYDVCEWRVLERRSNF